MAEGYSEKTGDPWRQSFDSRCKFDDCKSFKKKSENIMGTKIEEDKNRTVSMGNFDGISKEGKEKERLQNKKSDEPSCQKETTIIHYTPPNLMKIIQKYPDILKKLHCALQDKEFLYMNEDYSCTFKLENFEHDPIRFLDDKDLQPISHNSNEQSLLKENVEEWKDLIESLQNQFACIIISEEDFSVTFVCATAYNSQHITSEISKFIKKNSNDIKISPHVMEFVRHSKKFSDLEITAEDEIWIRNIKKPRLRELKKEMEKVASQSYLLDENQYELLSENKKEILTNVEKKFQVKGSLYQLPVVGEIGMVFQINPLTSISCIVNSDPENVAVDSLISIYWQTSKSTSGQ